MVIFFLTAIAVLALLNVYIGMRGWQALPPHSTWRTLYVAALLFFSLSFVAGRLLERVWLSPVSEGLTWIGSYWLAAMLYFFLAVVVIDLFRLLVAVVPFVPDQFLMYLRAQRGWILAGVMILVALLLVVGHWNASIPRVKRLELTLVHPLKGERSLRVVAASDIHLGTIIGRTRLDRIVRMINELNPDLVLLPGDVVDEDIAPVIRENLGESLREIKSRYGVYSVTGNHEYIGGADEACRYLEEHGVQVLRDRVATLPNGLQIVGREDRSMRQFTGRARKPLKDLLDGLDRARPILLMDHQPFQLEEAAEAGVDLQLSGHTHHGQVWPINYITNAIYEKSWGYLKLGGTHFYVSSGVGTWGPPVRLGNTPEILLLDLHF
jgi:predicted MPP superfamily phosphohydrolase